MKTNSELKKDAIYKALNYLLVPDDAIKVTKDALMNTICQFSNIPEDEECFVGESGRGMFTYLIHSLYEFLDKLDKAGIYKTEDLEGIINNEGRNDQADDSQVSCLECHKKEEFISLLKNQLDKGNEQINWSLKNGVDMCRMMRSLQLKYGIKNAPSDDAELILSYKKELIETFCEIFEIDELELKDNFPYIFEDALITHS